MSTQGLILLLQTQLSVSQGDERGFRIVTKVGDLVEVGSFSNEEINELMEHESHLNGNSEDRQIPTGIFEHFVEVLYPKVISVCRLGGFERMVKQLKSSHENHDCAIVHEFAYVCERLSKHDRSDIMVLARDFDHFQL